MTLTKTEEIIIKHVAENTGIISSTLKSIYASFRSGADCPKNAPQYIDDLWREAQERNRFEV